MDPETVKPLSEKGRMETLEVATQIESLRPNEIARDSVTSTGREYYETLAEHFAANDLHQAQSLQHLLEPIVYANEDAAPSDA